MTVDIPTRAAIAEERLRRQLLTVAGLADPAHVVGWLGAVQAQEYEHAKWALGLRLREGIAADEVERAFNDGRILRTHVMRPTWHFVTADDVGWLLDLTAEGVHRRMAPYDRQLGLDRRTMTRATRVFERALRDRRFLTRAELGERLRDAGLPLNSMRLAHVTMHAELERVICSGPRRGGKFTYALLAECAPASAPLKRDEALARLAERFFTSHGPATARDFGWWSGLSMPDAKRALDIIGARRIEWNDHTYCTVRRPRGTKRDHVAHMLPIYDEYLVAYRDRDAVPHGPTTRTGSGFLTFSHTVIVGGHVVGTWRPVRSSRGVDVHVSAHRRLTRGERAAISEAAQRYASFLQTPSSLTIRQG
jgi:hypothetical protein